MTPLPLFRNEEVIRINPDQETLIERYTEEAIAFIERNDRSPFFLYIPHNAPHVPLHVSPRFRGKSRGGLYGDVVEALDWSVGEIVGTIENHGLRENTLIIFTSDNGPTLKHGAQGGDAGRLRGGKGSSNEGGVRVPFIASWPGHLPAGSSVDVPVATIDMLPTLIGRCGGVVPDDRPIDGIDIWPVLTGRSEVAHDALYFFIATSEPRAVRAGEWKLNLKTGELYNLDTDPGERADVSRDHLDLVNDLTARTEAWIAQVLEEASLPHPPC